MPNHTFTTSDLTTFCRLDELGLVAVGQQFEPESTVIECRPSTQHVAGASEQVSVRVLFDHVAAGHTCLGLKGIVVDHLTVSWVTAGLGVS